MSKSLSWKLLLPLGLIIWGLGKYFSETTIGSAAAFLGLFIFVMGLIAAGRAAFNRKQI